MSKARFTNTYVRTMRIASLGSHVIGKFARRLTWEAALVSGLFHFRSWPISPFAVVQGYV